MLYKCKTYKILIIIIIVDNNNDYYYCEMVQFKNLKSIDSGQVKEK